MRDHVVAVRLGLCLAGAGIPFVACGSGSGGFVSTGGSSPTDDAGDSGSGELVSSDASYASDDGGVGELFTGSDAASGVMFACEPGTYSGAFMTMVTSDAGGLASLFSFNWTGTLSITLQGRVTTTGSGEIPEPTLTIAPGAKLAGTDSFGGHFSADLSGQLDCPSKTLTATVLNGSYNYFGSDAGGISMQGGMSATYDGTGSAPMLAMGAMNLSSPQLTGIAALGTWSATLQ